MKSALPKVLHPVAGAAMVHWAIEAALGSGSDDVVLVVGHGREAVETAVHERFGAQVGFALQAEQRGTADAVRAGLGGVRPSVEEVMITYGDVPCVEAAALSELAALRAASGAKLALLTTTVDDPRGYGRILRDAAGQVVAIREHRDCSPAEAAVREVNPGFYCVDRAFLEAALGRIGSANSQGEFYLTDLVALAAAEGTVASLPWSAASLQGVNDRAELVRVEDLLLARIAEAHRRAGVRVASGARVERDVVLAPDASIGPGCVLRGRTRVGGGTVVDVGCVLDDVVLGEGVTVKPYSVLARCRIETGAQIGPFAHLRPDSVVEEGAHVGNFVELKKTRLGKGAKANHLAYLGDGDVGAGANIGAGTIFCNYDGARKHVTVVKEGAFVGSNSSLVAPVTIGVGAYVGSGSVVTLDVPDDALAVSRARQVNKEGYASKLRARAQRKG